MHTLVWVIPIGPCFLKAPHFHIHPQGAGQDIGIMLGFFHENHLPEHCCHPMLKTPLDFMPRDRSHAYTASWTLALLKSFQAVEVTAYLPEVPHFHPLPWRNAQQRPRGGYGEDRSIHVQKGHDCAVTRQGPNPHLRWGNRARGHHSAPQHRIIVLVACQGGIPPYPC